MKKAFSRNVLGLGIGHFLFCDLLEGINGIRACASIFKSGAALAPATDKDPNIPLFIYGQTGVIMRIIHALLVKYNRRLADLFACMVIAADHAQQVPILCSGGSSIHEKGLINCRGINRQRDVFGGISSQPSRVLVSIL